MTSSHRYGTVYAQFLSLAREAGVATMRYSTLCVLFSLIVAKGGFRRLRAATPYAGGAVTFAPVGKSNQKRRAGFHPRAPTPPQNRMPKDGTVLVRRCGRRLTSPPEATTKGHCNSSIPVLAMYKRTLRF